MSCKTYLKTKNFLGYNGWGHTHQLAEHAQKSFGMDLSPKLHETQHLKQDTDILRMIPRTKSYTSATSTLTKMECIVTAQIEMRKEMSGTVSFSIN